jgi:hypothetical protein
MNFTNIEIIIEIIILFILFLIVIFTFLFSFFYKGQKGDDGIQGLIGKQGNYINTKGQFFETNYLNLDLSSEDKILNFFSNQFITIQNKEINKKIILGNGWNLGTFIYIDTGNLTSNVKLCSVCEDGIGNICDNDCTDLQSIHKTFDSTGKLKGLNMILSPKKFYKLMNLNSSQGQIVIPYIFSSI